MQADAITDVGDANTGAHLAYGDSNQSFTADAWFEADYIILSMFNPNVTRIPDAHFIWEAKHAGARVVAVSPEYSPAPSTRISGSTSARERIRFCTCHSFR